MDEDPITSITMTERVNGWWVTAHRASGHDEHHGPYPDEERAHAEAKLLSDGNDALLPPVS